MSFLAQITHLTVPSDSNNHKARLLHPTILFTLAAFVLVTQFTLQIAVTSNIAVLGYAANISVDEVVKLTNDKRIENGAAALTNNSQLAAAALAKANDMIDDDYWAHVAPDGTEPWTFFNNAGYIYKYAGENLARDFSSPQSAVEAWMASPTHRENLLSDKYDEIGVAVVEGDLGGVDTTIIVQLFGKSLDNIPSIPIASATEEELSPVVAGEEKVTEVTTSVILTDLPPARSSYMSISPLFTTQVFSFGLMMILAVVMLIDVTIITRKNVTRKSGRVFAHLAFFGMIVAIILIARAGQIL